MTNPSVENENEKNAQERKMMTEAYVLGGVRRVYDLRGDFEAAHAAEDDLHQEVLLAIARGRCEDPAACASAALRTQGIDFARYCA